MGSVKFKNEKGQGLVEYLILTALLAIATMGVVRLLGHSVAARYADVVNVIEGGERARRRTQTEQVGEEDYRKRDMSDFMRNAANHSRRNSGGGSDDGD